MAARITVAEDRRALGRRLKCEPGAEDPLRIRADQPVPAGRDGLGPFGFIAQGQAGHAQEVRLALHPARVRGDQPGVLFQHDHVEVAHGIDEANVVVEAHIRSFEGLACARMCGENHGLWHPVERVYDLAESFGIIGVGGAMHRDQRIAPGLEFQARQRIRLAPGHRPIPEHRIQHHVTHPVHLRIDPLGGQPPHGGLAGAEVDVGQAIGHQPVDLLRHTAVIAPLAGLDVGGRDAQLGGSQRAARVELVSPRTMTRSGCSLSSTSSKRIRISAV